jgi:hypothetical protein
MSGRIGWCSLALLACSVFPEHAVSIGSGGAGGSLSGAGGAFNTGGVGALEGPAGTSGTALGGSWGATNGGRPVVAAGGAGGLDLPVAGDNGSAATNAGGNESAGAGGAGSSTCPGAITRFLDASADAWVTEADAKANYETALGLEVGTLDGELAHSLVRFDLTPLTAGGNVVDAELSLSTRTSAGEIRTLAAHRISRDWQERRVNWSEATPSADWNTPGGDAERVASATATVLLGTPVGERVSWDVTADVQADVLRGRSFGWLLKEVEPGLGRVELASRESPGNAPVLTVVTCP